MMCSRTSCAINQVRVQNHFSAYDYFSTTSQFTRLLSAKLARSSELEAEKQEYYSRASCLLVDIIILASDLIFLKYSIIYFEVIDLRRFHFTSFFLHLFLKLKLVEHNQAPPLQESIIIQLH